MTESLVGLYMVCRITGECDSPASVGKASDIPHIAEISLALTFYDLVDKSGRRYSPYGWRIRMALAHKGLDAAVELCWHSDKEKLAFSGQHLVPVLRDPGKAVHDSWNIACYLDQTYPD